MADKKKQYSELLESLTRIEASLPWEDLEAIKRNNERLLKLLDKLKAYNERREAERREAEQA